MAKRRLRLWRLKTTSEQVLDVDVYYDEGGANYFTGGTSPRGYNFSVQPVTVEARDGYETTSFSAFSGVRGFYQEAKRYSDKKLETLQAAALEKPEDFPLVRQLVQHVLNKSGLVLADPPEFLKESVAA